MPGGCPGGGMLKLRFDWYIIFYQRIDAKVFGLYGVRNVIAPKGQ